MTFKTLPFSLLFCTSLLGSMAHAQSDAARLAAQTFVDACITTDGDAQLARLALARAGDFPKKKRPRGLLGQELGSGDMDSYTHRAGQVTALVMASRLGRDICAVGVKRPKNLDATNRAIATYLAQSPSATNGRVTTQKKGRRAVYMVQMGRYRVTVDKSLAGKNTTINMK